MLKFSKYQILPKICPDKSKNKTGAIIMKKYLQMPFSTREYMLSKDFELFYYNDKHITPLKEHSHKYYEFYFFLGGEVSITIQNQTYSLQKGDMILLPPSVKHYITIHNPEIAYQRFVFWITADFANELEQTSSDYVYLLKHANENKQYIYHFDTITFNTIQSKLFLISDKIHFQHFGKDLKLSLATKDFILHLSRIVYETVHPHVTKEQKGLFEKLIDYIDEHLEEDLSLEHLSKLFFVNKYHIAHLFKEKYGLPVHQYVIKKRLSLCKDAILNNAEISEIYLLCGFSDYSSFYRAFKKEYGLSPKEYKNQYLKFDKISSNESKK